MYEDDNGFEDEDEFMFSEYAVDDTLDGLTRLEKYYNSEFNLQRLVLVRDIYDTAVDAGYEQSKKRLLPLLTNFVSDSEPAVRQVFAEQLYPLALLFLDNAEGSEGYNELIGTFVPYTFELIIDKKTEVAEVATDSLLRMAELIKKEHIESQLLSVVVNLAHDDRVEEYRIAAAKLFNQLAHIFGDKLCRDVVVTEMASLAEDASLVVRKTVSQNLGKICMIIGTECTVQKVLPFFLELAKDDIWGVRKACVESLPAIAKCVTSKIRTTVLSELFETFCDDVSRWVKMEAYKQLGPLIATFKGNEVNDRLVHHFTDMAYQGEQSDSDMVEFCAFNFPAVALTIGPERWNLLEPAFLALYKDMQWKVRRSLACSLHDVANIVGTEITERTLLSAFEKFLEDLDEVKMGVVSNLASFMQVLSPKMRSKYLGVICFLPDKTDVWRIRDEISKQLGDLAQLLPPTEVRTKLLPLAFKLMDDQFHVVRKTALQCTGKVMARLHDDPQGEADFIEFLRSMAVSPSFTKRQMFIIACSHMVDFVQPQIFEKEFLPLVDKMKTDRVSNIRIGLAKLITDDILQNDDWKDNDVIESIREHLKHDKDRDVVYFSNRAKIKEVRTHEPVDHPHSSSLAKGGDNAVQQKKDKGSDEKGE
eukprot:CAMPEP_0117445108 /NCGR_PEP_ID=MMETSP0759-20121206/5614_1 /TAXON_ID=63605 /ORGANISM="Percolomonas cosmopolitus, Strain WS" /LENGTH=646 /DNA_ID=CAMNT_0005237251 /DNA_START=2048 /DNA_END=3988 /DNA_ORIENTATION=-